jgi:polysaccharide transporter, PST family
LAERQIFFVRQFAVYEFGIQATGLWQAVVRTSELYTQVFTALLGVVYYPGIATVIGQKEELNRVLKQAVLHWLPLILLGLIGVYLSRFQVLFFLFDQDFLAGAMFFKWQLTGDFFIMLSYFYAYVLLGKARIRLFICLQAFSAGLYILAVFFLYQHLGIEALPVAYLIRSAGYAVCLIIFTSRDI